MNIKNRLFALIFLGLATGYAGASPIAYGANADAVFDWSSFTIKSYSLDGSSAQPSLSWSNLSTTMRLETDLASHHPDASSPDWSSPLEITTGDASTSATAIAGGQAMHTVSSVAAGHSASSTSDRLGSFSVSGNGLLVFSVNYSLDAAVAAVNVPTDHPVYGFAEAAAFLFALKTGSAADAQSFYTENTISASVADALPAHQAGIMTLALLVHDGDFFDFQAGNFANASVTASAVPLPTAAWMFLSGLLGFLGVRRSKPAMGD